jgi:hypothetical protein
MWIFVVIFTCDVIDKSEENVPCACGIRNCTLSSFKSKKMIYFVPLPEYCSLIGVNPGGQVEE